MFSQTGPPSANLRGVSPALKLLLLCILSWFVFSPLHCKTYDGDGATNGMSTMLESGWYTSRTWWPWGHQHTPAFHIHFDFVCFVFLNSCPLKAHTCTCLFFCEHLCGRTKSMPSPLCLAPAYVLGLGSGEAIELGSNWSFQWREQSWLELLARCGCYVKLKALREGPEAEGVVTSISMAISALAKPGEGGGHVTPAGRSSSQGLTISP